MSNKHILQTATPQTIAAGDVTFTASAIPTSAVSGMTSKGSVRVAMDLPDLTGGPGFTYSSGPQTLTGGINASINQFDLGGADPVRDLLNGESVLVYLTTSDKERAGIYDITDVGGPDAYAGGTTYAADDQVKTTDIVWNSLAGSNTGNDPAATAASWSPILIQPAAAAAASAYAGGTTYAAGDVVLSSAVLYVSRQSGNTGNTPVSSAAWWTAIPATGSFNTTPGPMVLTRADNFNSSAEIAPGSFVLVTAGSEAGTFYYLSTVESSYVLDTTPLDFSPITTTGGTYLAGNGLLLTTDTFSVRTGVGLSISSSDVVVAVDGTTLSTAGGLVHIEDGGVGVTQLNTAVAGAGLTGGGGAALAINTGSGLEVDTDALRIAISAAGTGLTGGGGSALSIANGGVTETQLNASVAGNGLTGGAGTALAVGAGSGITVNANDVAVDVDGTTIQVGASGIELMGGSVARSYLESNVLNTIATGGASGTGTTSGSGTLDVAQFNVPVGTTVFAEIVVDAVNDAADSKRFIQKGYIGYRRGASGNAFPVGDSEDVTLFPAFAATGVGSIAAITWVTVAKGDSSGDVVVTVTGPGGGLNVTYACRVRLY